MSTQQLLMHSLRVVELNGSHSEFGGYRFNGFEFVNVKKSHGVRLVVLEINVQLRRLSIGLGQFRRTKVYIHSGKIVTPNRSGMIGFTVSDSKLSIICLLIDLLSLLPPFVWGALGTFQVP